MVLLNIVESKIFEAFIILCILISSILLTFNDVNLKTGSTANKTLSAFDYLFRIIFIIEMIMKWTAFGLKKYFNDWWCILDFIIVVVMKLFFLNCKHLIKVEKSLDFDSGFWLFPKQ